MRLLIVTQAVDTEDSALGFFHRWIAEFATHCTQVHVVCLREGKHALPSNVSIHSLGKEGGASRLKYIVRFYRYIWSLRNEYDSVFVHMNPEYVVLGGVFWRMWGKQIGLWYVHRSVRWWLRVASVLSNAIFSTAEQSINLSHRKNIHIVGHGVDMTLRRENPHTRLDTTPLVIGTVGRISRIKNIDTIVRAIQILRGQGIDSVLNIVGEPVTEDDKKYLSELKTIINESALTQVVTFRGRIPHREVPDFFSTCNLSINASPTGGIDKVVLESVLCGIIPIVSNQSFREIFGNTFDRILFVERSPESLAERITDLIKSEDVESLHTTLQRAVVESSDVSALIPRILSFYGSGK